MLTGDAQPVVKRSPGRPKETVAKVQPLIRTAVKKKRNLSPEGRVRIAEAAKSWWAAQGKAVASK